MLGTALSARLRENDEAPNGSKSVAILATALLGAQAALGASGTSLDANWTPPSWPDCSGHLGLRYVQGSVRSKA
jgi:heme A synthase